MNRVVHFELGAVDPLRAVEFYKNVFGWQAQQWGGEEYWLMKTGTSPEMGIDGAVLRNKDSQPRTVNSISVSSIEEYAAKVEQHGGKVVVPKMTVPTVGYLAYCNDTEATSSESSSRMVRQGNWKPSHKCFVSGHGFSRAESCRQNRGL